MKALGAVLAVIAVTLAADCVQRFMIAGFNSYAVYDHTVFAGVQRVRLERGASCTLEVVSSYLASGVVGAVGAKPDAGEEQRSAPAMDLVARLVLVGSGVSARVPADEVKTVPSSRFK